MHVIRAWGFTSFKELDYLNESIRVDISHKLGHDHHPCPIYSHRGLQENKVKVNLIEVVRIKIVTLNTKVSFDRFGKELRLNSALVLADLISSRKAR